VRLRPTDGREHKQKEKIGAGKSGDSQNITANRTAGGAQAAAAYLQKEGGVVKIRPRCFREK
jgi:hypothetical protein